MSYLLWYIYFVLLPVLWYFTPIFIIILMVTSSRTNLFDRFCFYFPLTFLFCLILYYHSDKLLLWKRSIFKKYISPNWFFDGNIHPNKPTIQRLQKKIVKLVPPRIQKVWQTTWWKPNKNCCCCSVISD